MIMIIMFTAHVGYVPKPHLSDMYLHVRLHMRVCVQHPSLFWLIHSSCMSEVVLVCTEGVGVD